MAENIGKVGVDTGMLLIIDPAYLFSEDDWRNVVVKRAQALGGDYPRAVLEVLSEGLRRPIKDLAVTVFTKGDGAFDVKQDEKGIHIEV